MALPFSIPARRQPILGITPGRCFFGHPALQQHPAGAYFVEGPAPQRAAGGYSVPSFHGSHPEGGALHRVCRQCRPVSIEGCRRLSLCLLAPARQPLALVRFHGGSTTPSLTLPVDACETGYPA